MKSPFCLITLLFVFISLHGTAQFWQSYSYCHRIQQYAGKEFKLEADVRVEAGENSIARVYARVDKADDTGFFENMKYKPITNPQWKTYSIQGIIDTGAVNLVFGGYCSGSGSSYFDNFKLSVKNNTGAFEIVYQTGFENGTKGWQPHIFMENQEEGNSSFFQKTVVPTTSTYKNVLKITGINVPSYGADKKAGAYAKVNGINLYYEIYGSGKPLLILHGNGGSISSAGPQIEFFKKKYKVIAIDSRGHGKSIDDSTTLTYDLMTSDVNELLNQLHIDSAYVWGHSDGAILSLLLAIDYPKKVKKAIAFAANLTPDTAAFSAAEIEDMKTIVQKTGNLKTKQLNKLMLDYPHIPFSDLHKIKAEILVMSGDDDVIKLSHTLDIYNHIERSNLCVMPGSTHSAAWEKMTLFEEVATDFFDHAFKK